MMLCEFVNTDGTSAPLCCVSEAKALSQPGKLPNRGYSGNVMFVHSSLLISHLFPPHIYNTEQQRKARSWSLWGGWKGQSILC